MPLAEFNFGTLKYAWDDPRLRDFQDNLDRVNDLAERASGFVWMLPSDAMSTAQDDPDGPLADRPKTASTLSVWRDASSLWHFVSKTVHARFLARADEWFVVDDRGHLVVWDIAPDHRPDVAEGMAMWDHLQQHGPTDRIFDCATLRRLAET